MIRHVSQRRSDGLPAGIDGAVATRGFGSGGAQAHPAPNPYQALGLVGRYRPRPGDADRHRRYAGRGPTPSRPATCGVPRSARQSAIPLHKHLDVVFTPPDRQRAPLRRRSNRDPCKAARTPHGIGVDRALGTRGSKQFAHLDEAAKAAVETAQFPRIVRARSSGVPRTRPRRPRPTNRPPAAPPRAPVPVPPRMERDRGVVAGIGVHQHGAVGVQRHGHPSREVAARAPGPRPGRPGPAAGNGGCRAPRTRPPSPARSGARAGPGARSRSRTRAGGAPPPRSR